MLDTGERESALSLSEADTCRIHITPALIDAGWDSHNQIAEQRTFTDGRVITAGAKPHRKKGKRADYILSLRRHHPIAVVEAKAYDEPVESGVQQAIDYAEILGCPFAYAANGQAIVERDLLNGTETRLGAFPGPGALWGRLRAHKGFSDAQVEALETPYYNDPHRTARYYQIIAINRAVEALLKGEERVLLTLATGTGKSYCASQICYRLWTAKWNRKGEPNRRPKILYLADRTVLLSQPMLGVFAPFGDAIHQIKGEAVKSREMYFATYQQIAEDASKPGLYKEYDPDFFDLVVVDECHRGSAKDDSNWRQILDYFTGAAKLGMTATPKRDDNVDTYEYFGNPIYQYSLKQGIDDGFLAPYRVRRVVIDVDATGWTPTKGQKDAKGEVIPEDFYETPDFEKVIVLPERTKAMAQYLTRFLQNTDPFGKTIVFCVDQAHAAAMREALIGLNPELVKDHSDYVCRVTADEGDIGKGHLDRFQDIDTQSPVVLTTSDMLTTGVDAPTAKNIVLARVVNSMTTFKQIIGRGTRLRTDYEKWYFTIIDFTGTATAKFADPAFDGFPEHIVEEGVEDDPVVVGPVVEPGDETPTGDETEDEGEVPPTGTETDGHQPRKKYYVDDLQVQIIADKVSELDADGNTLRTVKLSEYAGEKVRSLYPDADALRAQWKNGRLRDEVVSQLAERGIEIDFLAEQTGQAEADPFDLLCHVAFNAPVRTRRERAKAVREEDPDFWEQYSPEAREVLTALLDKYSEIGISGLRVPDVLEVPPLESFGTVIEVADRFGGASEMLAAITELQEHLYAA